MIKEEVFVITVKHQATVTNAGLLTESQIKTSFK